MRKDITFTSKGLHCSGWLFAPEGLQGQKAPTIVMGHGFTKVRIFKRVDTPKSKIVK